MLSLFKVAHPVPLLIPLLKINGALRAGARCTPAVKTASPTSSAAREEGEDDGGRGKIGQSPPEGNILWMGRRW